MNKAWQTHFIPLLILLFHEVPAMGGWKEKIGEFSEYLSALNAVNPQPEPCQEDGPTAPVPLKKFIPTQDQPEAIKSAAKSVRKLCVCDVSLGCSTIVAVQQPGRFVTNQHVVDLFKTEMKDLGCEGKVVAQLADGTVRAVHPKIIKSGKSSAKDGVVENNDDHNDLAILQIEELRDVPPLKLGTDNGNLGQKVYNIGFPAGKMYFLKRDPKDPLPHVSDGKVTAKSDVNMTADFLGVNGMSGGAVVSESGELLGIFWGHGNESPYEKAVFIGMNGPAPTLPSVTTPERSYFIPRNHVDSFLKVDLFDKIGSDSWK